jgi:deoxycytidylate deaminase
MFPISLIRHQNSELFFAIVAPVGANVSGVCDGLVEVLKVFDYRVEPIRVIEQLKQFDTYLRKEPVSEYEKSKMRMDAGDNFREKMGRDDALALLSLSAVVRFRNRNPPPEQGKTVPRQAYVFRSLKRPEEVTALRRIYGSNLIVIGVHSPRERRVEDLAKRIAKSHFSAQHDQFRDKAEELVLRDESDERKSHGQRLRSAFGMADFFLDSSDPQAITRDLERFLNLLFGKPVVTPTPDEMAMAHAHMAAVRSAEMGRQVGAAIADQWHNIIAVGTNEVPKARGGYYWDGDQNDGRDWSRGFDSSDYSKDTNLGELLQVLSDKGFLSKDFKRLSTPEKSATIAPLTKHTRYMQLIEFIRAVHAEMGALMDAASRGVPVRGCTMYITTFPCHECARNIIAAGIARVVYIEPYAKSLALELHSNAIQLDTDADADKIPFVPFLGVAPRNFSDIFAMPIRKAKNGEVIEWVAETANPRVSGSFWSYLEYEKEDLSLLRDKLKKKNLNLKSKQKKKGKS